jgi:DNA polymerase-3 subunit chi
MEAVGAATRSVREKILDREKRSSGVAATAPDAPTDVMFYHLDQHPLERVLPSLVERTVARGWRAVVQAGSAERLEAIDALLWTYRDDSFLAHGTEKDGPAGEQPVFLTTREENPNGAAVRFLVDGAKLAVLTGYLRVVLVFDGQDPTAVAAAREQWKAAKAQGCGVTYWQQTAHGGWEKKA